MEVRLRIKRYVKRALLLHRVGNPAYYHQAARMASIDRLQGLLGQLPHMSKQGAARWVLKYREDLERVLPHHTNKSFGKTRERLMELLSHCITITKSSTHETKRVHGNC